MSILKSRTDRRYLTEAAKLAAQICDDLIEHAKPGVSTLGLEAEAIKHLQANRSTAPFKSFDGFGHAICISINDEIVNGPPSRERILQKGNVVSIAIGTSQRGIHGKAARTAYIGGTPPIPIERLLTGTREILDRDSHRLQPGETVNQLLADMAAIAGKNDLRILANSGGCGIGKVLHMSPYIPNTLSELNQSIPMPEGFAFTLMPMMTLGESTEKLVHEDGWTQVTADHALSAHFADTMLMTEDGLLNLGRG